MRPARPFLLVLLLALLFPAACASGPVTMNRPPWLYFAPSGYGALVDSVSGDCNRDTSQTGRTDFDTAVYQGRVDGGPWATLGTVPKADLARSVVDGDTLWSWRPALLTWGLWEFRLQLLDTAGNTSCWALYRPVYYQPNPLDRPNVTLGP